MLRDSLTFGKSKNAPRAKLNFLRLAFMAAMGICSLQTPNANAKGLITTTGVQALMATETVSGSSQQTEVSVGPITNNDGSSSQTGLESGIDSTSLAVVPINASLGTTVYSSNQDAENAVSGYLKNYLQEIANAVVGSMRSSGTEIQLGMFTYIQNVQIANPNGGSPTNAQVYATVQVQPNGSYQYLGTNVNNNTLYLMYAIYQQSKDAAYLPAGWTVADSGETQWELDQITIEGNSIQSAPVSIDGSLWHIIQDNGAYDGVESVTNGVEKINYAPGVASWIKNQITPLMNQYNASMSVAMYGEQVKVSRNSAGQPLTAIDVTNRVYTQEDTPAACGQAAVNGNATLADSGQYGYLLNENENEYIVQPSGSYSMAGQDTANTISPTQNFNETISLGNGAQPANYEPDIVFPMAPDAGDLVNFTSGNPLPESDYTYVAPMQQNITQNNANGSSNYYQFSFNGLNYCVNFGQLQTYNSYLSVSTDCNRGVCRGSEVIDYPFSGPSVYINNQMVSPASFGSFYTRAGSGVNSYYVIPLHWDVDGNENSFYNTLMVCNSIYGPQLEFYGYNGNSFHISCTSQGCGNLGPYDNIRYEAGYSGEAGGEGATYGSFYGGW